MTNTCKRQQPPQPAVAQGYGAQAGKAGFPVQRSLDEDGILLSIKNKFLLQFNTRSNILTS